MGSDFLSSASAAQRLAYFTSPTLPILPSPLTLPLFPTQPISAAFSLKPFPLKTRTV
jgi:hypothetical protein